MNYLLDSNIVSDFYNPSGLCHEAIATKIAQLQEIDEICISVLSLYEFGYGLANAPENKRTLIQQQITAMQNHFTILPLSDRGALLFGQLKKALHINRMVMSKNTPKYDIDLMLATTAIIKDCILISADKVFLELQQINTQLKVKNWCF